MDVFMFPGQGSQHQGMGGTLFDQPPYCALEAQVDALLGYSVRAQCLDDPDQRLGQTRTTQPCLYVVNALHWYQARAEGRRADLLAGHSLGEYNALLAAGAFDFMTGLRLVQRRAELMSGACEGGMAAVLGISAAGVARLLEQDGLAQIDIANYNTPQQTVIAGPHAQLARARPLFEALDADMIKLAVSAAFHSRAMLPAARQFDRFLAPLRFRPLATPVIANASAQPYAADGSDVRALLVRQLAGPVRWSESIAALAARGATAFHEIGPGNVLARMMRHQALAAPA